MIKQILLVDVDSKIPNLALMKISLYYKSKGFQVDLKKLNYDYYSDKPTQTINAESYYKTFVSLIFPNNKDKVIIENSRMTIFGGTGEDIDARLDREIELYEPDYSIYYSDYSIAFITRGCPNNCSFCFVPKKEGKLTYDRDWKRQIKHKKVVFLDNNFLALPFHKLILKELKKMQVKFQFNQGLDIKRIDDENAKLLSESNWFGEYIFAYDNVNDLDIIEEKLKILKKYIGDWRIKFFLYCNPNMDIFTNVVFRVKWCFDNKVLPYLMRDKSCWDSKYRNFYIDLCAWCNQPSLFKKMKFEEFMLKRTKNKERQKESINLWKN